MTTKNGLFLMSIGLLIFVFGAVERETMRITGMFALVVAIVFIAAGVIVFYKGHKEHKKNDPKIQEKQNNESK